MNIILSALLWAIGLLYFAMVALFIAVGLLIVPSKKIYPFLRFLFRTQLMIMGVSLKVIGLENFDHRKAYIVMGNHQSLFDIFAIPAAVPMHFVAVEAASHFSFPIWGWLTRKWGNIPMPRKDLPKAIESINKARKVIASGTSIGILPEGTRTLTGEIGEFKKGPFHLALAAQADILPFALHGLFEYNNKLSWALNPTTAYVKFGKPIPYESFKNSSVEELKDRVYNMIIEIQNN
ncbi:lysophospholipid acyltransferase family protein [Thermodesulfobacteriota bacterium]